MSISATNSVYSSFLSSVMRPVRFGYNTVVDGYDSLSRYIRGSNGHLDLNELRSRITISSEENQHKITCAARDIFSFAAWGTWIGQTALTGVGPLNLSQVFSRGDPFLHQTNFALLGFPLTSAASMKLDFHAYRKAAKIKDSENMDYVRTSVVSHIFSVIGGIFFTLSKFAAESTYAFSLGMLMLPFYSVAYLMQAGIHSWQAKKSRVFLKEIFGKEENLDDISKVKEALMLVKSKLTVSLKEIQQIEAELDANPELRSNRGKRNKELQKRKSDLAYMKFKRLERRIGSSSAKILVYRMQNALQELRYGKTGAAKSLIQILQSGIKDQIKDNLKKIMIALITIAAFIAFTLLSGGAAAPVILPMFF